MQQHQTGLGTAGQYQQPPQQSGDSISGKISAFDMDWSIGSATAIGGYHSTRSAVRFGSSSSQTSQNSGDICRICHCECEPQNPLLTPCYCSGSLKYVHQACLQQWLTASETNSCELCKFPFIMHTKIKPFNEWRALQMSGIERRRLFCSVLFHCAAATCVIWSLCVLIERATEEVKRGLISWPFWTKLVVVTVGLTGGVVFMYIQCKAYLNLCTRWRARNRILLIQNAPEKIAPPPQAPQQQRQPSDMRDSPPMMFNRTSTAMATTPGRLSNTSGMGTQVSTMALNRSVYSAASHGQIVANIESNSHESGSSRQSRDWANVHVEDMAFHSEEGFRSDEAAAGASSRGTHVNMFKVHNQPQVPSSAIFLENQDILSDTQAMGARRPLDEQQPVHGRTKFNRQRHSLWVDSNCESAGLNQSDFRRYSDTRLIMEPDEQQQHHHHHHQHQIFNVATALAPPLGYGGPGNQDCGEASIEIESNPQITDILFESAEHGSSFDPLELNIQELLELDIRTNVRGGGGGGTGGPVVQGATGADNEFRSSQLSVNSDPQKYFKQEGRQQQQSEQKHLLTPQSLPNLSASSENLLLHPQ